ncbi:MAG: flagellar basal body P-ring formation chaperone FlgA [Bacteriovoracaceae bacterium]
MKKVFFLSCIIPLTSLAQDVALSKSCDIKTYAQIILTQRKSAKDLQNEIIQSSTCDAATLSAFVTTIMGAEGDLRAEHLVTLLEEQNINQEINLEPTKITINRLENIVKDRTSLNTGYELSGIQFVGMEGAITLNEQDRIKIECSQCELLGDQNLKILVTNPVMNQAKSFWARSQITRKIKVWKVRQDLTTMTEGNISNQLTLEEIAVTHPENYLNDTQDLKFYKLNKSLRRGDIVKQSDVSPIVLIKSGNRVRIKIENKALNLSSTGVANKSGSYGDSIELTNLNSKKKVVGRVVDYNTVVIDI